MEDQRPVKVVVAYSNNSKRCKQMFGMIKGYEFTGIEYLCVDTEECRTPLVEIGLRGVPSVIMKFKNGQYSIFEGPNALKWFQDMIKRHQQSTQNGRKRIAHTKRTSSIEWEEEENGHSATGDYQTMEDYQKRTKLNHNPPRRRRQPKQTSIVMSESESDSDLDSDSEGEDEGSEIEEETSPMRGIKKEGLTATQMAERMRKEAEKIEEERQSRG